MNTSPLSETALILQKGVAAARSGRYIEARQLLQRVVTADANNEMAWLWLSSLVSTSQQRQACLERVLQANPDNAYARAGLARLGETLREESAVLEERLAAVTSGPGYDLAGPTSAQQEEPTGKSAFGHPAFPASGDDVDEVPVASTPEESTPSPPQQTLRSEQPHLLNEMEVLCPYCDEPILPTANICPHCFISFKPFEELLERGGKRSSSNCHPLPKRKRRGILGRLTFF